MDKYLIKKLSDESIKRKLSQICTEYITSAEHVLSNHAVSFNVAHDTYNCYRAFTQADLELYDRNAPRFYTMPLTANHVSTMASFITGTLFGVESPLRVKSRSPEAAAKADLVNQLLSWNNEQQHAGYYQLGYLWVESSLLYNRGVMYESWREKYKLAFEDEEYVSSPAKMQPVTLEDGTEAVQEVPEVKSLRKKKVRKKVFGYNHIELVAPYDFISDPIMPLHRYQEGRFAGHRSMTTWTALKLRAQCDEDSPDYVFPDAVEKLNGKTDGMGNVGTRMPKSGQSDKLISRTAHERASVSSGNPLVSTDKIDGGAVELHELWVRISPKSIGLGEETTPELYRILVGNRKEILAVEESTYLHDEFPYAVGEARPSAFYNFAPSWALMLKPIQDMVDYLKDRHQDALARTIGNIFIARSQFVDLEDFTNPNKDGLILPVTADTPASMPLNEIVKQVELTDMTANFYQEVGLLMGFSEQITAASASMQGDGGTDISATQFVGQMEMASGRLMTVARLLANQGLLPQTRRFVSSFQQFLGEDTELQIKIRGRGFEFRPEFSQSGFVTITKDAIQGDFDFTAEDITLPGTQTKMIAAATRVMETALQFPALYDPADPTAINIKAVLYETLKATGMNVQNFFNGPEAAQQAAQKMMGNKPPMESKDISALASLIKAIKPESIGAVEPILDYIFGNLGVGADQQEALKQELGKPSEPSGGERVPIPDAMGTNDPGMPNVEAMPEVGIQQIRPNHL
jgi:hypothetical protein